eukprot:TRINITY_DN8802_c0_g1_i4.p1 TRINITY_DN8802_c0_g1~~TRINITY_DN8802_c0_g1_i4.p1  ORF type:complete len:367 (-),score=26.50 TRINITY_DN8802_c0_g1_i4:253-1248(-)
MNIKSSLNYYSNLNQKPLAFTCTCQKVNRRALLSLVSVPVLTVKPSKAATQLDLEDVLDKFNVLFPPEPVKIPRKTLNESFAVLLMRSCYEAVDALDFVPMDKFQVKFWKLRQSELEPYTLQYSPVKVRMGELSDPLYFDFISFSQFASIQKELADAQMVFKEYCGDCDDGSYRVVKRDSSISDNTQLPGLFSKKAGDLIYTGLLEGFRGEQFGAPAPVKATDPNFSAKLLQQNLQRLLDIMVQKGYAINANLSNFDYSQEQESSTFNVYVKAPANLWGLQNLQFRRSPIYNVYDAMVLDGYLRQCGFISNYNFKLTDTGISERWQIRQIL